MKSVLAIVVAILLFGAGVLLAPRLQLLLAGLGEPPGAAPPTVERKPIKYRHPMNPSIFSDTPAQDDMGMDYIPVYADEDQSHAAAPEPGIRIAPEMVANLGVRTAPVERGDLSRRIETVGYIDYDERVRIDSWYVRNWSMWQDIVLLVRTVSVVLKRKGAY